MQLENELLVGLATSRGLQRFGVLSIDHRSFAVELSGKPLRLTRVEFDLLELLARNPGKVVAYGQLIEQVLGFRFVRESTSLRVHLTHLRSKLGSAAGAIVTVRGRGLLFDPHSL